jgi:hypothetical protein
MKKYIVPTLDELSFDAEDMITASGDQTSGIVSNDDKAGAQGIDYQSWNGAWN